MTRLVAVSAALSLTLAGCATTGQAGLSGRMPNFRPAAPAQPVESFAYRPGADRNVRVSVDRVVLKGDPGFIPQDANWLQVHVTVANVGPRVVSIGTVKEKLADGTVLPSALSATDLVKPPSYVKDGLATVGIGTAGMVAGSLLFPPLALVSGAAIAFAPMMKGDQMSRTIARVQKEGLQVEEIAPGTSTGGYVFLPAVRGQTALILFYVAGGATATVTVPRLPPVAGAHAP